MTLQDTIQLHRDLYRKDIHIDRLVSRQPPTTLDVNTGQLHVEDGTRVGMNMAGRLLKYLSHPEGYGADFPWSKAWWKLRVECRRRHRHHRGQVFVRRDGKEVDLWNGSLCHELVAFVVAREYSVYNAAQILLYDNPEPVLRYAFGFMEATLDDFRREQERLAKEDEGHALTCGCGHAWSRHDDPATMFRCTDCSCQRYNAAKAA